MGDAEHFFEDIEATRAAARERAKADQQRIGERAREARGDISQAYAVLALEQEHGLVLSTRALSEIESGKRSLKLSEAVILAGFYGVELTALTPDGTTSRQAAIGRGASELLRVRNYIDERITVLEQEGE
ncbi:hypothetical protein [Aeromicrobium wangtongii]|uniref:HTH cro/C1-type domain-containing protein n=1 Tax=Aeromicrobium wangtongii TaxID=2969247 RepID=A0ABY5MCW9_9ACTN|nr:hypothetical protein [Aeromicrobium wangtongii]MCD9197481.1 hypothetical protein [Aeromicrobium wangtongii]UUP14973.1 hypothetical protein NQV15_06590 [Aeromicrobium wangtongii]